MEDPDYKNSPFDDEFCDNDESQSTSVDDTDYVDPAECMPIEEIIQKNVSKNIRTLRAFVPQFITEKNDQKTNIINTFEKKPYVIPDNKIEEFFTILEACRLEKRDLHFSERQVNETVEKSGIMIDFDIYQKTNTIQVTDAQISIFIKHLATLLNEHLEIDPSQPFKFHVFIIKKPEIATIKTADGEHYKDGFHILIPEVQVSRAYKKFLLQELVEKGLVKKTFRAVDFIDDPDKALDKMSASAPVYFLGSCKTGAVAYPLHAAYEISVDVENEDINRQLLRVPDLQAAGWNLSYELSLSFNLPSIGGRPTWLKKRQYVYKPHIEAKLNNMAEKTARDIFDDGELRRDEEDLSIVNLNNPRAAYLMSLLRIIDVKYASEYESWFKVICAVAHCGTTEDYKTVAREFSKRRPDSWSNVEFERIWNEAAMGKHHGPPVTIGSIKYWAKTSSPQAYAEIEKENYGNILRRDAYENEGKVNHVTVAKLIKTMCSDKFVVDTGIDEKLGKKGYLWFEFVTPGQAMRRGEVYKWRNEVDPDNVHLFIGDHLPKVFDQVKENIKQRKEAATDEAEGKYWALVDRNFKDSRYKLGDDTYQNKVINQARYRFRMRGFIDELDSYEDIIGVGNGVLKLGSSPKLIRGYHEYKISKFTQVDYEPFNPENNIYQKTLMNAFRDMYPEPDVLFFMLMHMGTSVDARESDCIAVFEVGGGQNGKSFKAKMVHNALGNEYSASGKPALLTAPMERGENANSAQMQQRGKRWFYMEEFNKCETINTARLKSVVTPGWQSGRDLHTKQCNFKNTSNLIAMSNFDFIVDTTDHGTWRRIYYYRNKVKFTQNPDPNNPFEKKADDRYIKEYANDPNYQKAMLSIMVHYNSLLWRDYGADLKNVPCPTIARETETFRNRQDSLNRFITEYLVKSPCAQPIGLTAICTRYSSWYSQNIKPGASPALNVLAAEFENSQIGPFLRSINENLKIVCGLRLKEQPEEPLEDGESFIGSRGWESAIGAGKCNLAQDNIADTIITQKNDELDDFLTLERNAKISTQKRPAREHNLDELIDVLLNEDSFITESSGPADDSFLGDI